MTGIIRVFNHVTGSLAHDTDHNSNKNEQGISELKQRVAGEHERM